MNGQGKGRADPDIAVTQGGSRAFRVLNFEIYTRPTRLMRTIGYAGSAVALGTALYLILATEDE